jgi:predicted ester cyclase
MLKLKTPEDNRSLVRAYAAAFNRGDVEAGCRCFAPDAVVCGVLGWGGLDKARPIWEQLVTCFRMNLQIESLVAEEEIVAARYTERGKFIPAFRGIEPTDKCYELVAMQWFEIRDGSIVKRWGARDSAAMFRQRGISLT